VYQFGWFSTGRDEAAGDLLQVVQDTIEHGDMNAEIAFVFSNRAPGESAESDRFFQLVRGYSIPLATFSDRAFRGNRSMDSDWRLDYDRQVMKRLEGFKPDLCVLAGYMLIVGKEMCRRYNMLNLHPAAPGGPKGTWQEVIWQLIASRAEETGVMMHLVTPELDEGPPATYCTFPIRGEPFDRYWQDIQGNTPEQIEKELGEDNPLFRLIREYGLAREFPLIVATLRAFSQGKVGIKGRKIVDSGGKAIAAYDLTAEINDKIKEQF